MEIGPHQRPGFAAAVVLGLSTLVLLGFYRPWVPLPFDITDFSEFLGALREFGSLAERLSWLSEYYAGHGRSHWLVQAAIAADYTTFGENNVGWVSRRVVLMVLNSLLLVVFLVRLRIPGMAAGVAGSLLLFSSSAIQASMRLTGEPIGLTCLLGAALIGTLYQNATAWGRSAAAIALLTFLAVLSKETFVSVVPPLLVFCLAYSDCRLRAIKWDRRNVTLVAAVLGLTAVALLRIVFVANVAGDGAYVQRFGEGALVVGGFVGRFQASLLPLRVGAAFPVVAVLLANAVFLLVLAVEGIRALREGKRDSLAKAALALSVLVFGALIYLPWPGFPSFYALPYFAAAAMLFGGALGALERRSRWAAVLIGALVLGPAAFAASGSVASTTASWRLNHAISLALGPVPQGDTLLVAVSNRYELVWTQRGPVLARYSHAIGDAATAERPARDVLCSELPEVLSGTIGVVIVSYHNVCGPLPNGLTVEGRPPTAAQWTGRPRFEPPRADVLLVPGALR